jgi:translation initiation factor 3 subunit H
LVLLKIIKHCTENFPEVVTGQLLGLDVGDKLEVTNCFPIPSEVNNENDIDDYQIEMMKCFRSVNVDNNTVGWYQSALLGSFLNYSIIEEQYKYQIEIPSSVVVVYDPFRTTNGHLALKAYRLSDDFMKLYAKGELSHTNFFEHNIDSTGIFEEIPIKVHNSHLVHGFLYELREDSSMNCDFSRLSVSNHPFIEKTLGVLSHCIDDYSSEQSKFQYIQRQIARQKQTIQAAETKRNQENESRVALGQDPLAEEKLAVKTIPQPSRLETMLICNQMSNYCKQIQDTASLSFSKLYVVESLAKQDPPQ